MTIAADPLPIANTRRRSRGRDPVAVLGSPSGRLLAGAPGLEDLHDHHKRLGVVPDWSTRGSDLLAVVKDSGLTGRGGGAFPAFRKLLSSRNAPGVPVVVVNGTESEPASAKDRLLLTTRPHLVIDGAMVAAMCVGADTIIVATHVGSPVTAVLAGALEDRVRGRASVWRGAQVHMVEVPYGYLAGESSALVSYLSGGPALPASRDVPTSVSGVAGRPTVVNNAETVAHLGLIARFGAEWFRQGGSPGAPGSFLLTFAGDVTDPGTVVEVTGPATLADAAAAVDVQLHKDQAILLGGYGGRWVRADRLLSTVLDPATLEARGTPIGCGIVGVLGAQRCGLGEAGRILGWLAGERAGQCGACTAGMPDLAARMSDIASGVRAGRRHRNQLLGIAHSVFGRGLCHLPDGAIAMMESSLVVFEDEMDLHRRGRCSGAAREDAPFPLPPRSAGGGVIR